MADRVANRFTDNRFSMVGERRIDLAHALGLATEAASQAQHQNDSHDGDQHPATTCAVCVVLSMAQQMVFATPALLLLPDAVELLYLVTDAELAHLSESWPGFQSRAPPVS